MKKIILIIMALTVFSSCARNTKPNSDSPMKDKYGVISVSNEAKKQLAKEEASNSGESKVICDRVTKTGSRIPVVTCKTIAEYKRDRKKSQEAIKRARNATNRNMGKFVN